jgi:hypothetical protein
MRRNGAQEQARNGVARFPQTGLPVSFGKGLTASPSPAKQVEK